MSQKFFYDQNVRKWMYQIIRLFSEFTVQFGLNPDGSQAYSTVPVIYGDATFSAATIARLNSENVMPNFPMISIWVSNLKFERANTYTPTFEKTQSVRTRQWDANVGAYLPTQANAYTVKRFIPVPYTLTVKVDIVTSNTDQKCQILEQILPLFNPALEIQKDDNYLDWESLSFLELDDVTWSNRSIPTNQANDSSYDVCTLSFHAPIWMSLPAKVSKMGVIFKVIANINGISSGDLQDIVFNTRQVVTFNNYGLYVNDGQIRILPQHTNYPNANTDIVGNYFDALTDENDENIGMEQENTNFAPPSPAPIGQFYYGQPLEWTGILATYGKFNSGVSMIGLSFDESPNEILGTITVNPIDPTVLFYNANAATLPANTLPSINMVVDPQQVAPGIGLVNANIGQSYLITNDIGTMWPYDTTNANAHANVNDIITFTGNAWTTSFSASDNIGNIQFVFDNTANLQYRWNGNAWVHGWQGPYDNAHWRMII
jgi:hypothetical protein